MHPQCVHQYTSNKCVNIQCTCQSTHKACINTHIIHVSYTYNACINTHNTCVKAHMMHASMHAQCVCVSMHTQYLCQHTQTACINACTIHTCVNTHTHNACINTHTITLYMTHSQNLNWANGLMFAHTKSRPTIMLCISILFCVIHSIKKYI